ncbi:MAG: 16S rRNA (adenine(1518)-N(6)/adenine(1519)-N(6))-dimethyltransferase RsmA [Patescibacteria group bacterium]
MKIKPKKSWGQNFLVDQQIAEDFAEAAQVNKADAVLEVGAGLGAVTAPLARKAQKVIAVELDRELIPTLKENLQEFRNVEVVNDDILKIDLAGLNLNNFKLVGAIPYQITSPLIHKIMHSSTRPQSITFIMQREVAEKIVAQPPKATYLSNFVANFGEAKIKKIIKPGAFNPPPAVDSAILHITLFKEPRIKDTYQLEKILHRGFLQPRKMIHHRFPAEDLQQTQISPTLRPANLGKEDWQKLYEKFGKRSDRKRKKSRRGGGVWIKGGA